MPSQRIGSGARHDFLEHGTQGELGVLSEAPQVQYCIVAARSALVPAPPECARALQSHLAIG